MVRSAGSLIGATVLLLFGPNAFAAPVIASATRTDPFVSSSTGQVVVPLRDDETETLKFRTNSANQSVVIVYNAECLVTAERGVRLTIKILVDDVEAEPAAGTDFSLCSAVDAQGLTWASVVRQSVVTVPEPGKHTVKVVARLRGGAGTWRLDDTSLVVQRGVRAFATRDLPTESSSVIKLPIKQSGGKTLKFNTTAANEVLKVTYNAECVVGAEVGSTVSVLNFVADAAVPTQFELLCGAVDTTGKTPAGAARQTIVTIPEAGNHVATVSGGFAVGSGSGRVDDSSLVITEKVLVSSVNDDDFAGNSTDPLPVTLNDDGDQELLFNTTKVNQVVKITFNAQCRVSAVRGRWLGIRIVVDGNEASPASGFDFAFCSSIAPGFFHHTNGYRQSVITIPSPGVHAVRLFSKLSDTGTWGLGRMSLTVE